MHELAELRRQLAESNKVRAHGNPRFRPRTRAVLNPPHGGKVGARAQLYFHALVLNMKMNSLHSGRAGMTNVDSQLLFEQCLQERIPIGEWPNYVSKSF